MRAVEFFSGIGGWAYSLRGIRSSSVIVAAFDINEDSNIVYKHNLIVPPSPRNLETITAKVLDELRADLFMMSPPCQPYTRSNKSATRDDKDPRAKAFLNIIKQLPLMAVPPSYIALENVVGFETSECCSLFLSSLNSLGYSYQQFHLTPTQFGIPNDRPRYYCIAHKASAPQVNDPIAILTALPGRDTVPPVPLSTFLDPLLSHEQLEALVVPADLLDKSAAWCFDIVTPGDIRSSCFTKAYTKFIRGAGSVLATGTVGGSEEPVLFLEAPEERSFDADWQSKLQGRRLRYFAPLELTHMFGFPSPEFSFPPQLSNRKCFELIGNSLNVVISQALLEHLLAEEPI